MRIFAPSGMNPNVLPTIDAFRVLFRRMRRRRAVLYTWAILRRTIAVLVLILILLWVFLQQAWVQRMLVEQSIGWLREKLNTKVEAESISWSFFNRVTLNHLYVEDQQGDTLLYIGGLSTSASAHLIGLITGDLDLDQVTLQQANIRLVRDSSLHTFNWDFVQKAFASKDTTPKTGPGWLKHLDVDRVLLEDTRFLQLDEDKGKLLDVFLRHGEIEIQSIKLQQKKFELGHVLLQEPRVVVADAPKSQWYLANRSKLTANSPASASIPVDTNTFHLDILSFALEKGQFIYDNWRKNPVKTTPLTELDYRHMRIADIDIRIRKFALENWTFQGSLDQIALKESSGFVLDTLRSGFAYIDTSRVELRDMRIVTPHSNIGDQLEFKYGSFPAWEEFNDQVYLKTSLRRSNLAIRDLMTFAPGLRQIALFKANENAVLQLNGKVQGKVNNLKGKDLDIRLGNQLLLQGEINSRDIAVKGSEYMDIRLDQLKTSVATVRQLIPSLRLPSNFNNLGKVDMNGHFTGFFNDFVANGKLNSSIGKASFDIKLEPASANKTRYNGLLGLENFDLGAFTGNQDFGNTTANAVIVRGSGFTLDKLDLPIKAEITEFNFKKYAYRNATVDGRISNRFFNGKLAMKNDDIDFDFFGTVNLKDKIPVFDFTADVKKADLYSLKLWKQPLTLSGQVKINARDANVDRVNGTAQIAQLKIQRGDTLNFIDQASIAITGNDSFKRTNIAIDRLGTFQLDGKYQPTQLPDVFRAMAHRVYRPYAEFLAIKKPLQPVAAVQLTLKGQLDDEQHLLGIVAPKLDTLREYTFDGKYESAEDLLEFSLLGGSKVRLDKNVIIYQPALLYDGKNNTANLLVLNNGISIGNMRLPQLQITGDYLDSIFHFDIIAYTPFTFKGAQDLNAKGMEFDLNAQLGPENKGFKLLLNGSEITVMQEKWKSIGNNALYFGPGYLNVDHIGFSNARRSIEVTSVGDKGLEASINGFSLSLIDSIWEDKNLNFKGAFNLKVAAEDIKNLRGWSSTLKSDTLWIHGQDTSAWDDWGALTLEASTPSLKDRIQHKISMKRGNRYIQANGYWNLSEKAMKDNELNFKGSNAFEFNIQSAYWPIAITRYWIGPFVSNIQGNFSADLKVYRPTWKGKEEITGGATIHSGGLTVDYLKTRYFIQEQKIKATSTLFDATGAVITDELGNKATIASGGLTHDHLKRLGLNVQLKTDKFLALNTTKKDNNYYYGRILAKGNIGFEGKTFEAININIDAQNAEKSLIVMPIFRPTETAAVGFIQFVQNNDTTRQNIPLSGPNKGPRLNPTGIALNMNLVMDEKMEVQLLFDDRTGHMIKGNGNGNLRLEVPRGGSIKMYGDYTISTGSYDFALFSLTKKTFIVKSGGVIKWDTGDPFDAHLNLEAEYQGLKAPLTTFLAEYLAADETLTSEAGTPTLVELKMKLEGSLQRPQINFDIQIPNVSSRLANYVNNRLRTIRQDQNEMNRQVFGLIVSNSFLPQGNVPLVDAQTAFTTMAEFLSAQLSNYITELLTDVIRENGPVSGLNVGIRYNQFAFSQNQLGREIELRPKVDLFNDRLTITSGLAFSVQGLQNSGIFNIGDVLIEYAITEDRRFRVRMYNQNNYNVTANGRLFRQGIGVSYRREFDSLEEFFKGMKAAASKSLKEDLQ